MNKLKNMKSIKAISKVSRSKYEILYEDNTRSIVFPNELPNVKYVLERSPVIRSDLGLQCPICELSMKQFYRYKWHTKIFPKTGKVLEYNRNKFSEEIIINICSHCDISKYPWEDGTELIYDKPLKKFTYGHSIRIQNILENPESCTGIKKFAMGYKHGKFTCLHKDLCDKAGCSPAWVFFINDSSIILMDDIIDGGLYIYNYMDFPFLEPVLCMNGQ